MNTQRNTTNYNEQHMNYELSCQYKRQLKLGKTTNTTQKHENMRMIITIRMMMNTRNGGGYGENTHNKNR